MRECHNAVRPLDAGRHDFAGSHERIVTDSLPKGVARPLPPPPPPALKSKWCCATYYSPAPFPPHAPLPCEGWSLFAIAAAAFRHAGLSVWLLWMHVLRLWPGPIGNGGSATVTGGSHAPTHEYSAREGGWRARL